MSLDYKITKHDCNEILKKHLNTSNFTIINFQEDSVSNEVMGIMAGHYKLKTTAKIEDKIVSNRFFVKKMTSNYDIQTEMIRQQGAYKKEHFAYTTMSKLYGDKCDYMTNCYLTIKDVLFVFEDVTDRGYIPHKMDLEFLDMNHVKLALKNLANFHAGSIIYETKQSILLGRKYKMTDDFQEYFKDSLYRKDEPKYLGSLFFKTCVNSVLQLIDIMPMFKDNKKEIRSTFLTAVEKVYDLVKDSDKYCNVICHGDLWNSNILFKYNDDNQPIECKLLDFQAIRYTIPAHDFLYFVYFNCSEHVNEKGYDTLARHYHDCLEYYLKENMINVNEHITFEEFLETIDYILPFVIVQNSCFFTLCLMRLYEEIMYDDQSFKTFLYEDRNALCVKAYKENEIFREIADKTLADLCKL